MEDVLFRLSIVWIVLHVILFFVERYRYKQGDWSWYGFKYNGMLDITYCILSIDILGVSAAIMIGIVYWIFQPIIK